MTARPASSKAGPSAGASTASGVTTPIGSTKGGPAGQVVKTVRFRRDRASKACEVCHARKVRCDMTENFPCTNCRAFSLVCQPRKGRTKRQGSSESSQPADEDLAPTLSTVSGTLSAHELESVRSLPGHTEATASPKESPSTSQAMPNSLHPKVGTKAGKNGIERTLKRINIPSEYVYYPSGLTNDISAGESRRTNRNGENILVEPSPLAKSKREGAIFDSLLPEDELVSDVLHECMARVFLPTCDADFIAAKAYGAFLLPTPELSDQLVDLYFLYVHPIIPVLNRRRFMQEYREDRDKPSLLIRQAIFSVSSRLSNHPGLMDETGTTRRAATVLYRRAKALFDVNYERTQETLISAAIILSMSVSNPLYLNHSALYWVHLAISLSQSIGLHRKLPKYTLEEQRQQRRIWWTVYKRDVSTSLAYGRPSVIRLEDCDVELISEDDFVNSEIDECDLPIDPGSKVGLNIAYFLQSVRLHEILALIIRLQFTVSAEYLRRVDENPDVTHFEGALAEWVAQIPSELRYSHRNIRNPKYSDPEQGDGHDFIRSLLHLEYYTTMSLSHRPQIVLLFRGQGDRATKQSAAVAFRATHMILKVFMAFQQHQEVRKLPGIAVYSIFYGVFMLSFQRRLAPSGSMLDKAVNERLSKFREIAMELAESHSAASWVAHLADVLQGEKMSQRVMRSMRQATSAAESRNDLASHPFGRFVDSNSGNSNWVNVGNGVPGNSRMVEAPTPGIEDNATPVDTQQRVVPYSSPAAENTENRSAVPKDLHTINVSGLTPKSAEYSEDIPREYGQDSQTSAANGHGLRNTGSPPGNQAQTTSHDAKPEVKSEVEENLNIEGLTNSEREKPDLDDAPINIKTPVNTGTTPLVLDSTPYTVDPAVFDGMNDVFEGTLPPELFPPNMLVMDDGTPEFPNNLTNDLTLGDDILSTGTSGDETLPDTANMADWYAYLNNTSMMNDQGGIELGDLAM